MALTENQKRLAQDLENRHELYFYSYKDERLYYVSEIEGFEYEQLKSLVLECEVRVGHMLAVIQEVDTRLSAGFDVPNSGATRKKVIFLKRFYKKLKAEMRVRDESRRAEQAEQVKEERIRQKNLSNQSGEHQAMLKKYEHEKRRIYHELIAAQLGRDVCEEFRDRSGYLANQLAPNPALPQNRHLWQEGGKAT